MASSWKRERRRRTFKVSTNITRSIIMMQNSRSLFLLFNQLNFDRSSIYEKKRMNTYTRTHMSVCFLSVAKRLYLVNKCLSFDQSSSFKKKNKTNSISIREFMLSNCFCDHQFEIRSIFAIDMNYMITKCAIESKFFRYHHSTTA